MSSAVPKRARSSSSSDDESAADAQVIDALHRAATRRIPDTITILVAHSPLGKNERLEYTLSRTALMHSTYLSTSPLRACADLTSSVIELVVPTTSKAALDCVMTAIAVAAPIIVDTNDEYANAAHVYEYLVGTSPTRVWMAVEYTFFAQTHVRAILGSVRERLYTHALDPNHVKIDQGRGTMYVDLWQTVQEGISASVYRDIIRLVERRRAECGSAASILNALAITMHASYSVMIEAEEVIMFNQNQRELPYVFYTAETDVYKHWVAATETGSE